MKTEPEKPDRKKDLFLALSVLVVMGFLADRAVGWLGMERFQTWLELHPRGFMMNRAGGSAWQEFQGKEITYTFTENRLRYSQEPDSGKTVLLLGDSFCFGLFLNDEDAPGWKLNARTREDSSGLRYLNGGVGGTGTADHAVLLETFGEIWNPQAVVLLLNSDDVDRAMAKNLFVLRNDSLQPSIRWSVSGWQRLFVKNPAHRWLQRHSFAYAAVEKLAWNTVFFNDTWDEGNNDPVLKPLTAQFDTASGYSTALAEKLMLRMHAWCKATQIPFIVVYQGFALPESASAYTRIFLRSAPDFFLREEIPFYDLSNAYRQPGMPEMSVWTLFPDAHPNAKATDIMAAEVHKIVVENGAM